WRRWAGGFRYDWSQFLQTPGLEQAIEPYISFWPSEFLRFRLAYKHTARAPLVSLAMLSMLSLLLPSGHAAQKLRVVTTIPDLKSLAEAVGGNLVEVDSLTRGTQNFHEAEVRPSMMLKLRRADALIENGAELDA